MKTRIAVTVGLAFLVALAAGAPAAAEEAPSLQESLDAKKAAFAESAPEDLQRDFAQGIDDVAESDVMETALKAGDRAPAFTLPNATGDMVSLEELLKDGPVVIAWYRGGWCPYCNMELAALQEALPAIREAGATAVAISPELPDHSLNTRQKNALEFEVLSDRGNAVAHKFGIVFTLPDVIAGHYKEMIDLEKYNGDNSDELPLAVTYVVDTDRVIRYAFVDADYTKRAEPKTIVEEVKKLTGTDGPPATG